MPDNIGGVDIFYLVSKLEMNLLQKFPYKYT